MSLNYALPSHADVDAFCDNLRKSLHAAIDKNLPVHLEVKPHFKPIPDSEDMVFQGDTWTIRYGGAVEKVGAKG